MQSLSISAPILEHVYELLWQGGSAIDLAKGLMELPMMEETAGMASPGLDDKPSGAVGNGGCSLT